MRSYLKIMTLMFKSGKRLIACLFMLLLFLLALEIAIPMGINCMISKIEVNQNLVFFLTSICSFVFAYAILSYLSALSTKLYIKIGDRLLWQMREKIYTVMWNSDYMTHVQKEKDKFKYVLSNQTYTAFAIAVIYTLGSITNLLTLVAFLTLVFTYSFWAGITLIICLICTFLISFATGKKILNGYEEYNDAQEKDSCQIYETVDLLETAKTNGLQDYYLKKNKKIHLEFMQKSEKTESTSAFCESIEDGFHSIIYIIVAGVMLLSKNNISSELITILFITNLTLNISQRTHRQLQVILKNIPVFRNIVELMDIPIEDGIAMEKVDKISFDDVAFEVDERVIFSGVRATIYRGDNVLIRGENGSGKSSLLKMLVGVYKPTDGTIQINDRRIEEYSPTAFYKEICYISQDEMMLNEKVEDYLRYITHSEASDEEIKKYRHMVNLKDEINVIEENGMTLSGGEKKKMFMLKCMLERKHTVIILDEIDAGVDIETTAKWKEIEESLKQDKNKILFKISHIDADTKGFDHVIQI